VEIFDTLGRRVRLLFEGELPGGPRTFVWDGRDERGRPQASGVYHARLLAPGHRVEIPIVLVR
jgi:flagellar hook assembly protein FlgD